MKRVLPLFGLMWVAVVLALGPPTVRADHLEAGIIVINTWDDDCSGSTRGNWDNMVDAWYDEIVSSALWRPSSSRINGNVENADFADSDLYAWGEDDAEGNLDGEDAIMIGLHGGEQEADGTNSWSGRMRVDNGAEDDNDCSAEQNTAPQAADNEILLDGDAEFVHLSSCHSMCDDNRSDWQDSYDGVHLVTGFHGLMWIYGHLIDDYEDFADDGFEVSIASAWLDELYKEEIGCYCDTRILGICVDYDYYEQCPVAQAAGTSVNSARDHRDDEEYDNILGDPNNPTAFAWTWISTCDPKSDPPQAP